MMKISELRIGNLVEHENKIYHITNLSLDIDDEYEPIIGFCELGKYTDEKQEVGNNLSNLKPIPLTEDRLINFGFTKDNFTFDKGKLSILIQTESFPNGRIFYNSWCIKESSPEFVHQLQNLYFALTGEELTPK